MSSDNEDKESAQSAEIIGMGEDGRREREKRASDVLLLEGIEKIEKMNGWEGREN